MIKKLLKSVREYKKDAILTPILVAFEVIFEVLITYFTAKMIDNGIDAGNMSVIIKIGLILTGMAILALIFGCISAVSCSKATAGFAKNLRHDIFYKIQNFSFYNIDKFKSSGLITRLTTDIQHISWAFETIIRVAVRSPLMIIFSFIMISKINMKIALIFLITMPILLVALIIIIKKVHPIFRAVYDEYDNLNNVVDENLNGIKVVKSFVQEDKEEKKFNKVSTKIFKMFKKGENLLALNGPIMSMSVYITLLLVAWVGAKLIVSDSLTTGELMSLFTYVSQVMQSLMMLSMIFVTVVISKESCERVVEVIDEEIDLTSKDNAIKEIKNGSIKFDNVSFSYAKEKKKYCLSNVNIDINSGEVIGIIGGTGSSKTTLVQLIPRLYDTTTGHIYVGGIDVKDYDLVSLRDAVSMVLQKNVLFSGTLRDNMKWGNEKATDKEIMEAIDLACAKEFVENMEGVLDYKIDQGGTNVSGGQKQRLCIARAILKQPKILIMDDSTSAVDTKTDSTIRKNLKTYLKDTTKIIIAQRISSVVDCDKIIVLDNGKIDGIGTHEELLKNNKIYSEVYNSQYGGVINE